MKTSNVIAALAVLTTIKFIFHHKKISGSAIGKI
jgi:hypothetical protein